MFLGLQHTHKQMFYFFMSVGMVSYGAELKFQKLCLNYAVIWG